MQTSQAKSAKQSAAPESAKANRSAREPDHQPERRKTFANQAALGVIQRKCACGGDSDEPCEACRAIQSKPAAGGRAGAAAATPAAVRAQLGAGRPLPPSVVRAMERGFGRNLSGVRLHTDAAAARLAHELNARAFTVGSHIAFKPGEFNPGSPEGDRLIAHEIAHTIQQDDHRPGAILDSYAAFEREADAAAGRVVAGEPVAAHAFSTPGLIIQADDDTKADATGLDNVPMCTMTASFTGLHFVPPASATLTWKTSWLRQVIAASLKRLLGTSQYSPGVLEDKAIAKFKFSLTGPLSNQAAEQEAQSKHTDTYFYPFNFEAEAALPLIDWLRGGDAGRKYEVDIFPSQEEVLRLGLSLNELWKIVSSLSRDLDNVLPPWYTEGIFRQDIKNFGDLLRKFSTEFEKKSDQQYVVGLSILDAIEPAVAAMEAIRKDPLLTANWEYALLWGLAAKPAGSAPPAANPPIAPDNASVGLPAVAMLSFARTQPQLMAGAVKQDDDAQQARADLLVRFGRFYKNAPTGLPGDLTLLRDPAKYNTPPFPATLSAYPEVKPPIYDVPLRAEYAFSMSLKVRDFAEAWASLSYRYLFETIKIPDERFLNTAPKNEAAQIYSRWQLYKGRIARDTRYNAADIVRFIGRQTQVLGPPGGEVGVLTLNSLLRYAGTTIHSVIETIADPDSLARFAFGEEGYYIVRCIAVASPPDNAAVLRPPSVAWLPVFARDPEMVAEDRLRQQLDAEDRGRARIAEIDTLLKNNPDRPDHDKLLEERERIEAQFDVQASLQVAQSDLEKRLDGPDVSEAEKEEIRKRLAQIGEILETREERGLKDSTTAERIPAVFVGDDGKVVNLALEAIDRGTSDMPPERRHYYVADATTPKSGDDDCDYTLTDDEKKKGRSAKALAIRCAAKKILESGMGYGRGLLTIRVDGVAYTERIEADWDQILLEGIENAVTVVSIAAIAAAPFTGGASLAILIPVGVVGAIPSAYRLATRAESGTLRWDMETALDLLNIASNFVGLGAEAAAAKRATRLAGALLITGLGLDGLQVALMGKQLVDQLDAVKDLPPGLRQAKVAEILGNALVQAGIMVGGALAAHYKVQEKGGVREKTIGEWEESLSPITKEMVQTDKTLFARFSEMTARVREIFTHCSDYCIPKYVTQEQAKRLESVLEKFKATPDDERALKVMFHDQVPKENPQATTQVEAIESVIKGLETIPTAADFRSMLAKTVPAADRVLGFMPVLRKDPALRTLVERILDPAKGGVSSRQLGDIVDNAKSRGVGVERLLGYIDKLTTHKPLKYGDVLNDLAKGYNFFTGAEWVLRWIDAQPERWSKVKSFEVLEIDEAGTRRWDANIDGVLFQFKSWSDFWSSTFLKQVHQDYEKTGGFGSRQVRWVFDSKIGDLAKVRAAAVEALEAARDAGDPRFSAAKVNAIIDYLDQMLKVGTD